jgi:predicted ATPase
MIKIVNYNLSYYRNIRTAVLNFENYNVIIGTNNSGKSNFIQSFGFLDFVINAAAEEVNQAFETGFKGGLYEKVLPNKHYITEDAAAVPSIRFQMEWENTETNRRFSYGLTLSWRAGHSVAMTPIFYIDGESLSYKDLGKPGTSVRIFGRHENKVTYGADFPKFKSEASLSPSVSTIRLLQVLGTANPAYSDALTSLNQVLKTPVFYFSHTELTKNSKDKLNVHNGRLIAFELEEEIIQLEQSPSWHIFKSAVHHVLGVDDVDIGSFKIGSNSHHSGQEIKYLSFTHARSIKNLKDFSDGSILLIALIVKVLNSGHDIFFIEEPENSTHPKALVDLVNFLQSFAEYKQFIITSHSIVLLNKSKVDQIITARQTEDGMSEFANVSSRKELKARLRSGITNFADELFFDQSEVEDFD